MILSWMWSERNAAYFRLADRPPGTRFVQKLLSPRPGLNKSATAPAGTWIPGGLKPGHRYEGFLLTSNGAVDTFTLTAGGLPPGLFMPATAAGGPSCSPRRRASPATSPR